MFCLPFETANKLNTLLQILSLCAWLVLTDTGCVIYHVEELINFRCQTQTFCIGCARCVGKNIARQIYFKSNLHKLNSIYHKLLQEVIVVWKKDKERLHKIRVWWRQNPKCMPAARDTLINNIENCMLELKTTPYDIILQRKLVELHYENDQLPTCPFGIDEFSCRNWDGSFRAWLQKVSRPVKFKFVDKFKFCNRVTTNPHADIICSPNSKKVVVNFKEINCDFLVNFFLSHHDRWGTLNTLLRETLASFPDVLVGFVISFYP